MFALCVVNLFVNLSQCCVCSRFNPYLCLLFAYKHNWLFIHILKEVIKSESLLEWSFSIIYSGYGTVIKK